MSHRAISRYRWIVWVFCAVPLYACGDKATTAEPAEPVANKTTTSRSLTSMGGGAGDKAPLAVPLESLNLDAPPVEEKTRERRSAKEVEACVDEKTRNFKGPNGEASAPSMEELRVLIESCGV